jgi:hypothetical protein
LRVTVGSVTPIGANHGKLYLPGRFPRFARWSGTCCRRRSRAWPGGPSALRAARPAAGARRLRALGVKLTDRGVGAQAARPSLRPPLLLGRLHPGRRSRTGERRAKVKSHHFLRCPVIFCEASAYHFMKGVEVGHSCLTFVARQTGMSDLRSLTFVAGQTGMSDVRIACFSLTGALS